MNYFKNLYLTTFRIIITKLPFIPPKRSDKQIKVTRINKLPPIRTKIYEY